MWGDSGTMEIPELLPEVTFLTCRAYVPINARALAILSIAERIDRATVTGQGAIWAKFIRAAVWRGKGRDCLEELELFQQVSLQN